jgi:putative PIN family toxin of toxin-antitoxin system
MRVILDTNILVSALLIRTGTPSEIYRAWVEGAFILITCQEQLDELRSTLRKPALKGRIRVDQAGRMINNLNALAVMVDSLPHVPRSPDPEDDFLLATAEVGHADYLVTGDKSGLLSLIKHQGTRILNASDFASRLR